MASISVNSLTHKSTYIYKRCVYFVEYVYLFHLLYTLVNVELCSVEVVCDAVEECALFSDECVQIACKECQLSYTAMNCTDAFIALCSRGTHVRKHRLLCTAGCGLRNKGGKKREGKRKRRRWY